MANNHLQPDGLRAGFTEIRRFLTSTHVLTGILVIVICAAFILETRWHRNLFYLIGVPTFLLALWAAPLQETWQRPLFRLILVYIFFFCFSALWSAAFSWGGFADLIRVSLLSLLFITIALFLAVTAKDFEATLFFWIAAAAGISLLALFAAVLVGLVEPGWRLSGFGLASHPVVGATLYGFALLICVFALIPNAGTKGESLAWAGVTALCGLFMLMSGSRGPLISICLSLGLCMVVTRSRNALLAVVGLLVALALGFWIGLPSIETTVMRAVSGHWEIWAQAIAAIIERPWFGYGALTDLTFQTANGTHRSPHNLFLANQLYGGLIASLLLALLLACAFWESAKAAKSGAPVYMALLVFGLGCSFFDTRSLVQNLGREWISIWLPLVLLTARQTLVTRTGS